MSGFVLGIDPGFATIGFALLKKDPIEIEFVSVLRTDKKREWGERILKISNEFSELLSKIDGKDLEVAIEKQFFNQNVTNSLLIAEAKGVLILEAAKKGKKVYEYTPLQIKQNLIGYGRATKYQIKNEIKRMFNLDTFISPDDASDAVAVALCHIFHSKVANLVL